MRRGLPLILVVFVVVISLFGNRSPVLGNQGTATPATETPAPSSGATGASQPVTDPLIDPFQTLGEVLVWSALTPPVSGTLAGDFDMSALDRRSIPAGVQVQDFFAEFQFPTPQFWPTGKWRVGFCFWSDPEGGCLDLSLEKNSLYTIWVLSSVASNGVIVPIDADPVPDDSFDLRPGASNSLAIVVYNGSAILADSNFREIAAVRLPGTPRPGDVAATLSFDADSISEPETLRMSISGSQVWDMTGIGLTVTAQETPGTSGPETPTSTLPALAAATPALAPAATQPTGAVASACGNQPATGAPVSTPTVEVAPTPNAGLDRLFARDRSLAMAQTPLVSNQTVTTAEYDGEFDAELMRVSVVDFYLTATFVNPGDLSVPWDIGVGFRDAGNNQEFRFVIDAWGVWTLACGLASPIDQGLAGMVDTRPGGTNTIEIIARGPTGMVAVNGIVIQEVDLSAALAPGDVYMASGMRLEDGLPGRGFEVRNISIYPLAP